MSDKFTISVVDSAQSDSILEYVKSFRKQLFPMLDPMVPSFDLVDFDYYYIKEGLFLQAQDTQGNTIGVIGMMPFKERFDYLTYQGQRAFEVARLFVEPNYRRQGVAQSLVKALKIKAKEKQAQVLYLHTHPFLTGAKEFWQTVDFCEFKTTQDGVFTTIHMQLVL